MRLFSVRRCLPAVAVSVLSFTLLGCAGDDAERTVEVPAAASPTVPIVNVAIPPGDGIALGEASESVNRGEAPTRPGADASPDDTEATDETDNTEATENAEAPDVERLSDDSVTCVTVRRLFELQDRTGELSREFQEKVVGLATTGTSEDIEAAFREFLDDFNKIADELRPELEELWATFSEEQPQLADDIAAIRAATLGSFEVFKDPDLTPDSFDDKLQEQVGAEVLVAGGLASLKLDEFTRAACDTPFANS